MAPAPTRAAPPSTAASCNLAPMRGPWPLPAAFSSTAAARLAATGPSGYATAGAWAASGKIAVSSSGALAIAAADSSTLDFSTTGTSLSSLYLGATGPYTYSGTLTPGSNGYLLGGGGGAPHGEQFAGREHLPDGQRQRHPHRLQHLHRRHDRRRRHAQVRLRHGHSLRDRLWQPVGQQRRHARSEQLLAHRQRP